MNDHSVAYLGIPGSFSHSIATRLFGASALFLPCASFRGIFDAVASGKCRNGVLPIENSLIGSIHENYDLLRSFDLPIVNEAILQIEHHFSAPAMSSSSAALADFHTLRSHPKAIEQCTRFLAANPHLRCETASDTATAAQEISRSQERGIGVICSEDAARLYGLTILQRNIQDFSNNQTRFAVIGQTPCPTEQSNKCSLVFTLPHAEKSLFRAFSVLMEEDINVSKIESRPIANKPFEYLFYIDFEFDPGSRKIIDQMAERFEKATLHTRWLGFYPRSGPARNAS